MAESFDSNALVSVLVEKGGYNKVDAENAAKGPRASELAKEFGVSSQASSSFSTPQDVTSYLSTYQDNLTKTISEAPAVEVPTADELKSTLTSGLTAPETINRVEARATKTEELGINDLETQLQDLTDQQALLQDNLRQLTGAEEGKPVAMNVIAGRITEEERQAYIRLDAVTRQINSVQGQLTTKYKIVDTYVSDLGLDYQDAVAAYESAFTKNYQVQSMLLDYKKMAQSSYEFKVSTAFNLLDEAKDTVKLAETIKQNNISTAQANLNTFVNAISSGNLTYDSLSSDQKLTITKLEAQAGLPSGFISSLQMSAKDQIMFTSTNDGVTQVGIWNSKTNSIDVKSYGTKKSTTTETESQKKSAAISTATQLLDMAKNSYGDVSPESWQQIRSAWLSDGLTAEDFNKNFSSYTDLNRGDFESAYGFKLTDVKSVQ